MPRKKLPPRLAFREDEGQWVIRDGQTYIRTGQGRDGHSVALRALAEYVEGLGPSAPAQPGEITVGEILASYVRERGDKLAAPQTLLYSAKALAPFRGDLTVDAVKGATCRRYAK